MHCEHACSCLLGATGHPIRCIHTHTHIHARLLCTQCVAHRNRHCCLERSSVRFARSAFRVAAAKRADITIINTCVRCGVHTLSLLYRRRLHPPPDSRSANLRAQQQQHGDDNDDAIYQPARTGTRIIMCAPSSCTPTSHKIAPSLTGRQAGRQTSA